MFKFRGETVLICLLAFLISTLQTVLLIYDFFVVVLCILHVLAFWEKQDSKTYRFFKDTLSAFLLLSIYIFHCCLSSWMVKALSLPLLCTIAAGWSCCWNQTILDVRKPKTQSIAFSGCTATQLCISPELCPLVSCFFLGFSCGYSLQTTWYRQLHPCSGILIAGTLR